MADTRATQGIAAVLGTAPADTRATLAAALALGSAPADARATQAVLLVVGRPPAPARVTQAVMLVVARATECLTQRCQCWSITRTDGVVYRLTTHDESVAFRGGVYSPCESLSASATDASTITNGGASDVQITGVLSDDVVSASDLANGLFDGATVEVWSVPWGALQDEAPRRLTKGLLGAVTQGTLTYQADILTAGLRLAQQPLLEAYTAGCRWTFGDARCGVDLMPITVAGAVTFVDARNAASRATYRQFNDGTRTETSGYFDFGVLTWTSGPNTGLRSEIKTYTADGWFTLWSPMPNEISFGDAYSASPGCDKLHATCIDKWDNQINFGGFPHVPGTDAIIKTPDAKQG